MKDIKIVLAEDSFTSLLYLSRWIEVFIVFAAYLHELLLFPYEQLEQQNMLVAGFYFVSGFSSEAVGIVIYLVDDDNNLYSRLCFFSHDRK